MRFKDFINNMSDDEYRGLPTPSYSLLKDLDDEGPSILVSPTVKKSKAFEFGSLVDIILTDPDSRYDKFHTKAIEKPTSSLLLLGDSLIEDIIDYLKNEKTVKSKEYIIEKCRKLGIWSKMSDDKIVERFDIPLLYNYIDETIAAAGKIVIEPKTLEDVEHCANVLKTHAYSSYIFEETEDIEVLTQVPIRFRFMGCDLKAKLDVLRIDHKEKKVYIYDIKTGAEMPSKFKISYIKYKYYLQALVYTLAVEWFIQNNHFDYTIESFEFVYISKKAMNYPIVIQVPFSRMDDYLNGWLHKDEWKTGLKTLIEDYLFYTENGIYDCERYIIENNGKVTL